MIERMRIAMLSDSEAKGGAAIAASRLAEVLAREGVEVFRIAGDSSKRNDKPWTTRILGLRMREQALMRALGSISERLEMLLVARLTSYRLDRLLREFRPDAINVHNLHANGWGSELVEVCARHAPTIWTLHDMWSFTGHCTYNDECRRFIDGCDASCPDPTAYPPLPPHMINRAWRQRQRLLSRVPGLVAVCPSRWLAQEALSGAWANHRVEVIAYGLPLDIYVPLDRSLARAALGIDSHGPVVLTVARKLQEGRKGGAILLDALNRTRNRPLTLVTLGAGRIPIEEDSVRIHPLGYIDHERTKVLAYNAADLMIHPALADNLPNVVLESIACGTPCLGFSVGGVPDMIREGLTGWLAEETTAEALANVLDEALDQIVAGVNLRSSCRAVAEAEYDVTMEGQRYLSLLNSLTHH